MTKDSGIAIQLATLAICVAGAFLAIKPLRALGWRFLVVGVVIALAGSIITTQIQSDSYVAHLKQIIVWLGVTGVIAAVFGARRLAARFIMPAVVLLAVAVALALPMLQSLMTLLPSWWWVAPLILIAPLIAILITAGWQKSLRSYARDPRASRFVGRILDQMFNSRKIRRRPDRHIGNSARSTFRKGDQRRG